MDINAYQRNIETEFGYRNLITFSELKHQWVGMGTIDSTILDGTNSAKIMDRFPRQNRRQ